MVRSPVVLWLLLALCALAYAPTRWLHEANPVWRATAWLWALEVIAITLLVLKVSTVDRQAPKHRNFDTPTHRNTGPVVSLSRGRVVPISGFVVPITFFLVAVPWPWPVEQFLVQSLTRLNSGLTVELLGLLGIPAAQHGNVIEIAAGNVGIDEACSGIRSVQATLMISLFFGELYRLSILRRLLLLGGGLLLSSLFNLGRTLLLVSVASSQGLRTMARWHDPAGVIILVGCFICLWLVAVFLSRHRRDEGRGSRTEPMSPTSVLRPPSSVLGFSLLAWFLIVEAGTQLWYRSHERTSAMGTTWSIQTTSKGSEYERCGIPPLVSNEFRYDEGMNIAWRDPAEGRWQLFYFRWVPSTSLSRRVKVQRAKMHGPDTCLPHAGIALQSDLGSVTVPVNGLPFAFHQYSFQGDGRPFYVFFGIYEEGSRPSILANRRIGTIDRLRAALAGSRNYGQRFLEVAVWGYNGPEDARAALQRELARIVKVGK